MKIKNISLERRLLTQAQGYLADNGVTVLLGRNGSGKTTLFNYLAKRYPESAYLPQYNRVYDELLVAELLELGQARAVNPLKIDIINQLELTSLMTNNIQKLSGGQQKRVWLAFVLLQNAPIVLLDEPLAGLDLRYQHKLLALLRLLTSRVLISVHDINYAQYLADWIWILDDHYLSEGNANDMLQPKYLSNVFQTPIVQRMLNDGSTFFTF